MAKVLIVAPKFPYPPNDGVRLRLYNFIRVLSLKNEIILFALVESDEETKMVSYMKQYCCEIRTFARPEIQSWWKLKMRSISNILFEEKPFRVLCYYSSEMSKEINEAVKSYKIEIVYFYYAWMAIYIDNIESQKVCTILDSVDAFSSLYYQSFLKTKNTFKKIRFYFDWKKMVEFEREVFPKFGHLLIISPVDKSALESINPELNIHVVPNGVDLSYFHREKALSQNSNNLVFTGTMSYTPNIDAVSIFAKENFPLIRQVIPDAKFFIVGKNPSQEVMNLAFNDKIIVTGEVDDVRPYLDKASVFVCPIRFGAGLKNKVLEAMAMGLPVVCSKVALEGINAVVGQDVLVANTPDEFAKKTIDILLNKELKIMLSKNARMFVEKNHDWEKLSYKIQDIYNRCSSSS